MLVETAFREYREAMVKAMVSFCRDGEAARDGVSHAFAQALANKQTLETMPEAAMKAWLFAAARNAIVDIKRRERRFFSFPGEDVGSASAALDRIAELADTRMFDLTDRAAAEALMADLKPSLQEPVRLKFYGRMNATEIGKVMNLPPATVRTRLRTAMALMRNRLNR
jgi:RNA polymerase sigma-70 factor (ECF subfamily)